MTHMKMKTLLVASLALLLLPTASFAQGFSFYDDFERRDGPVGNGWLDSVNNQGPGPGLQIANGLVSNFGGENCIYRPIALNSTLLIEADLALFFDPGGAPVATAIVLGNRGGLATVDGYGLILVQAPSYGIYLIAVIDDGVLVDSMFLPLFAGRLSFMIQPNGKIVGAFQPYGIFGPFAQHLSVHINPPRIPFSFAAPARMSASGSNLAYSALGDAWLYRISA
ncbi:MAG: hypothetical protein ACI8Y8_004090, partial [Planctomycetota bacterium]